MKYLLVSLSIFSLVAFAGQAFADTSNSTTGANSTNESSTSISNTLTITNDNQMSVDNHVSIDSNTGGNSASSNTGNGSISTGSSSISVSIKNTGNTIGPDAAINPTNSGNGNSSGGNTNVGGQISTTTSQGTSQIKFNSVPGTGKIKLNISRDGSLEKTLVLGTSTDKTGGVLGISKDPSGSSSPKSTNWTLTDYVIRLGLPLLLLLGLAFALWAYFKGRRQSMAS